MLGALGSALGGFFGPVGSAVGGFLGNSLDRKSAASDARQAGDSEYARQKEFAQMGIRWKVADAKAAGLHPLAALGAQGSSYSPTVVMPGRPSDDGMMEMGQNLIRSKMATKTIEEKMLENATIRNAQLRNELLEAQIASLRQPSGPPMPDAVGVAPIGAVQMEPSKAISSAVSRPHLEAAPIPGLKDVRIGGGASLRLPSKEVSESLESLLPGTANFVTGLSAAREAVHGPQAPASNLLPKGYYWKWFPLSQSFRAVRSDSPRTRSRGASGSW